MAIIIKSPREIAFMKLAGEIVSEVFALLRVHTKPNVSTYELDQLVGKYIRSRGGIPSSYHYEGFPGNICISVNETLIHGIPSKKIILKEGDIVSYDVMVTYNGYVADACRTMPVGKISDEAQRLIDVTKSCFVNAVKLVKPGVHIGDISSIISETAHENGYTVTDMFTGHGVGREVHEDPYVPNVGLKGIGPILQKNMTIAIEPMVNQGKVDLEIDRDGWTVKTKDRKLACHYENTVVVTSSGYEILTLEKGEEI